MKKLLSKAVVCLLTLTVILGTENWPAIAASAAAAEGTVVNVYDATTFGEMLKTENTDILLWQNINYTGQDLVLCNSIDLNGYNLTCSNTLTFSEGKRTFKILDSRYSDNSSNTATFSDGIYITDGTLRIESGNISVLRNTTTGVISGIYGTGNVEFVGGKTTINGGTGSDGEKGSTGEAGRKGGSYGGSGRGGDGTNGRWGSDGGNGCDGGNGIQVANVTVYGGNVSITGGTGGNGGTGGTGGTGGAGGEHDVGGNGGSGGLGSYGGTGGNGGNGIQATNVTVYDGIVSVTGGKGGNGGTGGNGGAGGKGGSHYYDTQKSIGNGGNGGAGGNGFPGGNGGNGGNGIQATDVIVCGGDLVSNGCTHVFNGSHYYYQDGSGSGGKGGNGGAGGEHGKHYQTVSGLCSAKPGSNGNNGSNGSYGISGGAGIQARLTVKAGTVSAEGGKYSAGIGGTGNGQGIEGSDVTISGGTVTVTAGEKSFGIGGGFDCTKTGAAGKLTVTGGTLILSTYGRGTNATVPSFANCTVSGSGALQYEGTYNANGKFTVTVENINIQPAAFVGYDTVTVTATVRISRSTNITTPKLKGYISFQLDGQEFATAPITDAASTDGAITAAASATWTAVEGRHSLSAEYVADNNDPYASSGTYTKSTDIPLHTHKWNSNYTIDVQPTCTTPGSKSIHCSICDAQKDFATINAIGHNYVDHQCQNCQEFSPLVVFKDYDGTVLSSEYYYLGDSITEPTAPSRKADNTYTYTFIGWDKKVVACEGDAVYTAVYEATPIEYTVIFKNYDGSELLRNTYHYGDPVVTPSNIPKKPADSQYEYIFVGWDSAVCPCDGNKVYTAVFTSEFVEYTVTFKNYDGSIISTKTYHYGDAVQVPAAPSKASNSTYSYAFAGWDKKVTAVTGNATYTATYTETYIDYTVTFKDWNGAVLSTKLYHYGDKVAVPGNPTRAADKTYTYTFAGWDKAVVNCAGNATYTATYTETYIDYTVTFKDWNGAVLSTKLYHYGDKVAVPGNPTRAADKTYTYTFAGWDKAVVNCAGNATYTATYTNKYIDYTVIFQYKDGTVIKQYTLHYGDSVTTPADPAAPGNNYKFSGWDKNIVTVCQGNAVYTAVFVRQYIIGDLDGDEKITDKDAIYLLMHSYFPDDYPVDQPLDYNNDGLINDKDAIYLLMHCYFPEDYPITK